MEVKRNKYVEILKQFLNNDVKVYDDLGEETNGKCIALNFAHLNVIIEDKNKNFILIKNPKKILRYKV